MLKVMLNNNNPNPSPSQNVNYKHCFPYILLVRISNEYKYSYVTYRKLLWLWCVLLEHCFLEIVQHTCKFHHYHIQLF